MARRFTQIDIDEGVVLGDFYNKKITIAGSDMKALTFQAPRLYLPFGISGYSPPQGATKWNLDFALKGWNEDGGHVKRFYDWIRDLENKVISHIHNNSKDVFGMTSTRQQVEAMFSSNLRDAQGNYDPKLRVKADTWPDGSLKFKVFDAQQEDITAEAATDGLYKQHSGVALIELAGVWFFQRKFGITWRCTQLQVFETRSQQQQRLPEKCLINFDMVADI